MHLHKRSSLDTGATVPAESSLATSIGKIDEIDRFK
jgi:hypothetical protein